MLKERNQLIKLCVHSLESKGLNDQLHKDRLKKEVKEIDAQGEHEYLINLYQKFKVEKLIFPQNENNSLVDYLLGLTNEFDINKETAFVLGEMPDIDVDFLKDVRDYLKRVWAPKTFGQDRICEIGTYGTLGIKSSILDMTRVHNVPKDRIQAITSKMADKDDDGKELEWDKALEIYPEFRAYCEDYPEIASAAKILLDRNKTGGVHAGGLIISDRPLDGFIPLEVRNGVICSAWTQGLNRQDLEPVGLVKFDLLVINNLLQIAIACNLVKQRNNISSICALDGEGQLDWSDTFYLNDKKSLELADSGDLKCIFQFDSEGIRKLIKRGGVTSFDDLAVYSALYRPGPLNCVKIGTKVSISVGQKPIESLNKSDKIKYLNKEGNIAETDKYIVTKTGSKKMIKITTESGKFLYVSKDHLILGKDNYVLAGDLKVNQEIGIVDE